MAKFEIRRIVRELKKQRRQIDRALVALEGVEERSPKQNGRKVQPRLQVLPPIQPQSVKKAHVIPFIRPEIMVEAKRSSF